MKLYFKVHQSSTHPEAAEPLSSQPPNCTTSPQPDVILKEAEDPSENRIPSPHMNVIVKEEEEEEPLYGTLNCYFSSSILLKVHIPGDGM